MKRRGFFASLLGLPAAWAGSKAIAEHRQAWYPRYPHHPSFRWWGGEQVLNKAPVRYGYMTEHGFGSGASPEEARVDYERKTGRRLFGGG